MDFMLEGFKKMFLDIKSLKKKRIMQQIPNLLTLSRIILLPFILTSFLFGKPFLAILFIAIAEISDLLDGRIARKYKLVTKFGAYLDACCDKIFIFSLMICLFAMIDVNIELLGMVFVLELIIMLVNSYYRILGYDTSVNIYGKIKTMLLDLCIIIFYISYFLSWDSVAIVILVFLTLIGQIITIGTYLVKYIGGSSEVRR